MKPMSHVPFFLAVALLLSATGCSEDAPDSAGHRSSCRGGVACASGLTCSPTLEICVSPGDLGAACTSAEECGTDSCRKGVCAVSVELGGICQEHEDCASSSACVKPGGETSGICRRICDPAFACSSESDRCCLYAPLAEYVCAPSSLCE